MTNCSSFLLSLALLTCAGVAAQDFSRVEIETDDFRGDQAAGMPLWQTVIVDWDGEVEVKHFSPLHSDRFRGLVTADELAALEGAVRGARLGDGVPKRFSPAPWGDTFTVEGGPAELTGSTKGDTERAGAFRARLEPLRAIALRIAQRLIDPPALPPGQVRGRVELRGFSTYLALPGNRRYEVRPRALAEQLEVLEGEAIVVAGVLSGTSNYSRKVEVTALVEPVLRDLGGTLSSDGATLELGGRAVPLHASKDLADALALLPRALSLRGFVRDGPRGPRAIHALGVRASLRVDSWPLDAGDEVLVHEHSYGERVRVVRVADGRETSVDLDELRLSTVSAGLAGSLGQ